MVTSRAARASKARSVRDESADKSVLCRAQEPCNQKSHPGVL